MAELKLNSTNEIPAVEEIEANTPTTKEETYVKHEEATKRKLFANKKANIALGIMGGIIVLAIVAAVVFISI